MLTERLRLVINRTFTGVIIGLLLMVVSCRQCVTNPDGEEPRDTSIDLELGDVWTTSLTFRVSVVDTSNIWSFVLVRDDSTIMQHIVAGSDTTVRDGGLLPGREYHYRAYRLMDEVIVDSSAAVHAVTMKTTSHDFVWEIDTLGNYGSYLNDVWIVDENDIWVVGALTIEDSTLQYSGETNYNAARWNGNTWEYLRIWNPHVELYSIYYFSKTDIWVTSFGLPIHWDGNEWTLYHIQNMGIDASAGFDIWGTSSSNIYFVGYEGSIVHYDGLNFAKMETGTDVDLLSISGTPDGEYLFAAGYDSDAPAPSVALEYSAGAWRTLYYHEGYWPDSDTSGAVLGVYVKGDTAYFTRRGGLWKYNYLTGESSIIPAGENGYNRYGYSQIIVNGLNDIFIKDSGFSLLHYNGISWRTDVSINDIHGWYGLHSDSFDYKNNLLVMVGCYNCSYGHGLVVRGKRN